ncbi:MAG: N-acetylmuramic acid 6-phosphate etherase [Bacteroidia bacterium]|nr:N-acetylmuramic acid 6-phosphate etherase [Bacteroidia bacterium]MCX7651792.1 N-acetylmuramic acid 6-phosphate etherase [Bacteroidia bacterium]MDW8417106.1 N-acetylmuramic acid 6-phosphate etherase [Bacteroidia bacterium]
MSRWLTEEDSGYGAIEEWDTMVLLEVMHAEDKKAVEAVGKVLPQIAAFVDALVPRLTAGGRLIYIGAGTSGRLGVLDAAECLPTFGTTQVIGLIAGGEPALRQPVEAAEDDEAAAEHDLRSLRLGELDTVFGISASGRTPYVLAALRYARQLRALTGGFTANPDTPLEALVDYPVVVLTGPEVLTGSTRLKAGTATKLVLNMITTSAFARLGCVSGGRMIDLQLVNHKLWQRALRYLCEATNLPEAEAEALLRKTRSLRRAMELIRQQE